MRRIPPFMKVDEIMDATGANPPIGNVPKSKSAQTFEFITLTDSPRITDHDRLTVRKQAMKNNTNRRIKIAKDQSELPQRKKTTAPPINQQSEQTKKFRLLPRGLQDLQDMSKAVPSSRVVPLPSGPLAQCTDAASFGSRPAGRMCTSSVVGSSTGSWKRKQGSTGVENEEYNRQVSVMQYLPVPLDRIAGRLNPMATLPDGAPERTRMLIHHYFQSSNRSTSLMTGIRKDWFALGITDVCYFNTCLAFYAGAVSLAAGQGDSLESVSFTSKSITIVNERLTEDGSRIADGTLAAVASMVIHEVKNANKKSVEIHLMGMQEMIMLRGGLRSTKLPPSVQRIIGWAELNAASLLQKLTPTLELDSAGLDIPTYTCTAAPRAGTGPRFPCPSRNITWSVIDTNIPIILAELRFLSSILEVKDPKEIAEIDNIWYSDKVYLIQRNLTHMWVSPSAAGSRLDTLCCLAASIYVDSCLRDLGFHCPIIGHLVGLLKKDSEALIFSNDPNLFGCEVGDEVVERLMWVFGIASVASSSWPERDWFVEQFALACSSLKVTSWPQAESMLRKYMWNAQWVSSSPSFWNSVVNKEAPGPTRAKLSQVVES
ncbi:hypothetical protein VTL71DRAFT_15557 [Oculimacula yallundae]|uniref:Tachykinin family protein n=1 Tax=Oculimacula yallundae TaxID=86028 RepID=A0ABR4CGX8_9HELO